MMVFHCRRIAHQFFPFFIQKCAGDLLEILILDPYDKLQYLSQHILGRIRRCRYEVLRSDMVLRTDVPDSLHFHLKLALPFVDQPFQLDQHAIL